ncbi:MAG: TM2 domain-containing protein [Oscillospiraceae bacterium]|nr:TM2 domain-containing protein [Oscillospiraceae bacterium]
MYCTNCGRQIDPNAVICVHCGVRCGQVNTYCKNCGGTTIPNATICVRCGAPIQLYRKSRLTAGLLGFFLGCFGVHNFYLGYNGKAIAQLLITLLSFGLFSGISTVWGFVEGVLILTNPNATDAKGVPLTD